MSAFYWSMTDDLNEFDTGKFRAKPAKLQGLDALSFEGGDIAPVLLREPITMDSFVIRADVACTPNSFVGLVFGAADSDNFELVYLSADNSQALPNLQFDPVMNGSSTWQIYHGPRYQALVPVPSEQWVKLALEVRPDRVSVYVGEAAEPSLMIPILQHGQVSKGKIGVWGTSSGYIRNLSVEEISPANGMENKSEPDQQPAAFITEWMVAKLPEQSWMKTHVEENGTLNLNRLYTCEKGAVVQARCSFDLPAEKDTRLSFGYSDRLRLWVNDKEIYQGQWKWQAPGTASDGRIRADHISVPVHWQAGLNTLIAEIVSEEAMFGWGLSVKTGFPVTCCLEKRMIREEQ